MFDYRRVGGLIIKGNSNWKMDKSARIFKINVFAEVMHIHLSSTFKLGDGWMAMTD